MIIIPDIILIDRIDNSLRISKRTIAIGMNSILLSRQIEDYLITNGLKEKKHKADEI